MLTRFQVAPGDRFVRDGLFVTVDAMSIASPAFVRLRAEDGTIEELELDAFRNAYATGGIRRPLETNAVRSVSTNSVPDASRPHQLTEETEERLALMRHVQTLRTAGHTWKTVMAFLHESGFPVKGGQRPCKLKQRRIQEMYAEWMREGDRALEPRTDLRGNRDARYDELYADVANRVIDRLFVRSERMRVSKAASAAKAEYLEECRRRDVTPKACDLKAFESVLSQRSRLDLLAKRLDPRTAKKLLRQATRQFRNLFPLDRVELDCTVLPVHCRDEHLNPVGRPWVCAAIDVASRAVLAITVTLESPSGEVVLKTLKAAMRPTQPADMTDDADQFDPYGAIHTIAYDRGRENDNLAVRNFIHNLGLSTPNDIPGRPERRPHIERFFRTLKEALSELPGGVARVEAGAEKMTERAIERGTLTVEEVAGFVHSWVRDVYHHRPHQSLSQRFGKATTPSSAWAEMSDAIAINLPPSPEELYEASLLREDKPRKVQHYGVDVYGVQYHSRKLADLRMSKGEDLHVVVYIDPSDMRQIRAYSEDHKEFFDLPCRWDIPALTLKDLKSFKRRIKATDDDLNKAETIRRHIVEQAVETVSSPARKRAAREAKKARDRGKNTIEKSLEGPPPAFDLSSNGIDPKPPSKRITRSKGLL